MGYTFISYSRKQLYFAEAIAVHLQQAGIDVWFDLQKLQAGVSWQDALASGYLNCDRLVLVVSRSALISSYVTKEWKPVIESGREVILAVAEDVVIPEILRQKPTFDFQPNFDQKIKQLINYLNGKAPACQDIIPSPHLFPSKLPKDIKMLFWALTLPGILTLLTIGISIWLVAEPDVSLVVIGTIFGAIFALVGLGFLKHSLAEEDLERVLKGEAAGLALLLFCALITISAIWSRGFVWGNILYLLTICSIIGTIIFSLYALRQPKSADLLRWFPGGGASQELRYKFNGAGAEDLLLRESSFVTKPVDYSLKFDSADKPLADFVQEVVSSQGNILVDQEQAEKHLCIITNRTSRQMIEEFSHRHAGRAIYLLGSSVDKVDQLEKVFSTQLVDIRTLDRSKLVGLGQSLEDFESWSRLVALETTPKSFHDRYEPVGIQLYHALMAVQAVLLLSGYFPGSRPIFIIIACVLYIIMVLSSARRITFAPAAAVPLIFPIIITYTGWKEGGWSSAAEPLFLIVLYLFFVFSNRAWFPAKAPANKDMIGRKVSWKVRLFEVLFLILMAIVLYYILNM